LSGKEEIKRVCRRLIKKYHPDLNSGNKEKKIILKRRMFFYDKTCRAANKF